MNAAAVWQIATAVLTSLGGGTLIVFALSSWLGKVWAGRLLEQDRLRYQTELERIKSDLAQAERRFQGEIDKTVYVHRLHFETELASLKDLWNKTVQLRNAVNAFSPEVENAKRRLDTAVRAPFDLQHRQTLVAALEAANETMAAHEPFIPPEVQQQFMKLARVAGATVTISQGWAKNMNVDEQEARQAINAFYAECSKLADQIRERLKVLALYRGEQ